MGQFQYFCGIRLRDRRDATLLGWHNTCGSTENSFDVAFDRTALITFIYYTYFITATETMKNTAEFRGVIT
jgi:hypothetical protein